MAENSKPFELSFFSFTHLYVDSTVVQIYRLESTQVCVPFMCLTDMMKNNKLCLRNENRHVQLRWVILSSDNSTIQSVCSDSGPWHHMWPHRRTLILLKLKTFFVTIFLYPLEWILNVENYLALLLSCDKIEGSNSFVTKCNISNFES